MSKPEEYNNMMQGNQQPYMGAPPPYGNNQPPGSHSMYPPPGSQPMYPPPGSQPMYPPPGSQPMYPTPQQQQQQHQQHHQQQQGQQQPQVILVTEPVTRTVIIGQQMAGLGPNSLQTKCLSCQMTINTRLQQEKSNRAHLSALLLCLFCCWPCACIPYCMDSCKNTKHFCPNCNAFIGTYHA